MFCWPIRSISVNIFKNIQRIFESIFTNLQTCGLKKKIVKGPSNPSEVDVYYIFDGPPVDF